MSFHTLYITRQCHVKIKQSKLSIEGDDKVEIPLEDVQTVIFESRQVTVTTACLSELAKRGCEMIFCGENHSPVGVLFPFMPHSRQTLLNRRQLAWTDTFKKKCHQEIIKNKLRNQAICFELLTGDKNPIFKELSEKVLLGDKSGCEAHGASLYFDWYLNGEKRRNKNIFLNQAINYGYAIIRSRIVQALAVGGFIPSMGLFHRSELNNFNLADDMIEPFRPFVDYYVKIKLQNCEELLPKEKSIIIIMLEADIEREGRQRTTLSQAIQLSVNSLQKASEKQNSKLLNFPSLAPFKEHRYE